MVRVRVQVYVRVHMRLVIPKYTGNIYRMWQGEDLFLGHGQALRQAFATFYLKCQKALQVQKQKQKQKQKQNKQKTKMQRRGGIKGNRKNDLI